MTDYGGDGALGLGLLDNFYNDEFDKKKNRIFRRF